MRYKTLAAVLLKLMGVWFIASGAVSAGDAIIQFISLLGISGIAGQGSTNWFAFVWLLRPLLEVAVGVLLIARFRMFANLILPSNRTYCPDCGYELIPTGAAACPECGASAEMQGLGSS